MSDSDCCTCFENDLTFLTKEDWLPSEPCFTDDLNVSSELSPRKKQQKIRERGGLLSLLLESTRMNPTLSENSAEAELLFQRFFTRNDRGRGLRLQCEATGNTSLGNSWVSLDLKTLERQTGESGLVSLNFEDQYFDRVLCSDLDRASRPGSLINELHRVLRYNGEIWAQGPFTRAHDVMSGDFPDTYWRFTPHGFRVLFERFEEIMCSVYQLGDELLCSDSFFYGIKPAACMTQSKPCLSPARARLPF